MFANQQSFNHPMSRLQAMGADTRPEKAVVNLRGEPLFYNQTGGMRDPQRKALDEGDILYRFVARNTSPERAVTGGWWVDKSNFQKMCRFAQGNNTSVAMASRILCCVPPEWSNMGMLIRARVKTPLLAYCGLGKDVSITMEDGLGDVKMTAHNSISARRLYQLYIPGLHDIARKNPAQVLPGALVLEQSWIISERDASKGWLYL